MLDQEDMEVSYIEKFLDVGKDSDEFHRQCNKLAQDINDNNKTILDLVESLNLYLTDSLVQRRELGTQVLSEVISKLNKNVLSTSQLHFINKFYADRLKDHHQVIPAVLRGISSLLSHKNYPEGGCSEVLASLFHNVACQQQQREDRYIIYSIFKQYLELRANEIKSMGLDFIYGFITAVDSEKDPRNLVFLFSWLPELLKTVSLGHLKEEMFEVIACYFPIDFRVSAEDSLGITREALADVLAPCLCAVDEFAPDCINLVLEKLSSSMRIAKFDSLKVLKIGCGVFSEETFLLHSTELWTAIQEQVYKANGDYEIEALALETLSAIISKISESNTDSFKSLLSNITETSKLNLRPDAKLFRATGCILESISKGSKPASEHIIKECIPLLINTYQLLTTIPERLIIFQQLINLVAIYSKWNSLKEMEELNLIPNLCLQASIENNPQIRALGLNSLAIIHMCLPEEIRINLYKSMQIYLVLKQERIVREAFHHCLQKLSKTYTNEILPVIKEVKISNEDELIVFMECLAEIALVSDEIFLYLFHKCVGNDLTIAPFAFAALKAVVNKDGSVAVLKRLLTVHDFVKLLIDWIFTNLGNLSAEDSMMMNIGEVLKVIVSSQSYESQREIVQTHLKRVIEHFQCSKTEFLVFILSGFIIRLDRLVLNDFSFPDLVIEVAMTTCNELVQIESLQLVSNYLNKLESEAEVTRILDTLEKFDNVEISKRVNVYIWVTKALFMRSHPKSEKWLSLMVASLQIYESAAIGFKIVLDESYDAFSPKSNCQKKLLYKQRFFTLAMNIIKETYKDNAPGHLSAVAYMIQEVPQSVIKMQFDQLIRFISLGLEKISDITALLAILSTLNDMLQKKDPLMESYIQTILPKCLKLCSFKVSMKVRIAALNCIYCYAKAEYPLHKMLLYKPDVIVSLGRCLDDPKRLVRNKAAAARMYWYILGEPV